MSEQEKRAAFTKLEAIKNSTGLDSFQKAQHTQLARDLGGVVHADGVYYICYENKQPCDPENPPPGCTCKQMTY